MQMSRQVAEKRDGKLRTKRRSVEKRRIHVVLDPRLEVRTSLFGAVGGSFGHLGVDVHLGQVLLVALGGCLDSIITGVPVGGADLAVLVCELEGIDQTECLVDAAADGQVVDGDLSKLSVSIACIFQFIPPMISTSQSTMFLPVHIGTLTCLTIPCGSMMNRPLSAMPSSSISTP